jgi:hypothetical protein
MTVSDCARIAQHDKLKATSLVRQFERAALDCDADFINITFFISVLKIICNERNGKRVELTEIISLSGYSKSTFFRRYRRKEEFWSEMKALANNLIIKILEENVTSLREVQDRHVSDLIFFIQEVNNQIFSPLNRQGNDPLSVKVSNAYQLCLAIEETFKKACAKKNVKQDFSTAQLSKLLRFEMVDAFVTSNFFASVPQVRSPAVREKNFNNMRSNFF